MKPSIIATFLCVFGGQPVFAQFQSPKIVLSYNGLTQFGRTNRDSVELALSRLGVPFDTLDRNQAVGDTIDYTPYGTLIWASGDPTIAVIPSEPAGQAGLSANEIGEVEQFLKAGQSDCKKSLLIAGQNIAYEHGFLMPNGAIVDTEFLQLWLHVKYVADSPDSSIYTGRIVGQQAAYWNSTDSLFSSSPDVVRPTLKTALVGPVVNALAYTYAAPLTPSDSGAGVSFYNDSVNTIFYAFDWADLFQTPPNNTSENDLTSGTTRVLAAAFAFVTSHNYSCIESVRTENGDEPSLELQAIVPNPAQNRAEVFFTLPECSFVTIRILDILGRIVRAEFVQISMNTGSWNKTLDLAGIPAGNYTCELEANSASSGTLVVTENFVIR